MSGMLSGLTSTIGDVFGIRARANFRRDDAEGLRISVIARWM